MNLNPEEASDKNPLTQAVGGSEDFVATVGARFPSKGATRGAELLSLKNTGLVTSQSGLRMRIKNIRGWWTLVETLGLWGVPGRTGQLASGPRAALASS